MADVTGPISTLPGRGYDFPIGTRCDDHPDRPAVARIQGETDSFGCEMIDMCQECLAEHRAYVRSPEATTGRCDWCKAEVSDFRRTRDYEEGMYGPVYEVCGACRKRRDDATNAYLDSFGDGGWDEPDDYDLDDWDLDEDDHAYEEDGFSRPKSRVKGPRPFRATGTKRSRRRRRGRQKRGSR